MPKRYYPVTSTVTDRDKKSILVLTKNIKLQEKLKGFIEKNLKKEIEQLPDNDGEPLYSGYELYKLPKKWMKINMPKQYTDEERKKMAETFAQRTEKAAARRAEKQAEKTASKPAKDTIADREKRERAKNN